MNWHDLFQKAKADGAITDVEAAAALAALRRDRTGPEADDLIWVLGYGNRLEARPLMDEYLQWRDRPDLAREALQVLTTTWGLTREYADAITRFVHGVDWDTEEYIRLLAIDVADDLLDSRPELLRSLRDIAEDHESELFRDAACRALARGLGVSREGCAECQGLPEAIRVAVAQRLGEV
jgi:hypothetical protein